MTKFQRSIMGVFVTLGVLTGFVLSEMHDNKAYMLLAMGFVIPVFSLMLVPGKGSGWLHKLFSYTLMLAMSLGATARAAIASLELPGGHTALVTMIVLTSAALSLIIVARRYKVTLRIKMPLLGTRTFKG